MPAILRKIAPLFPQEGVWLFRSTHAFQEFWFQNLAQGSRIQGRRMGEESQHSCRLVRL